MFQAAVDGFGWAIGCSWAVEVSQYVIGPPFQGPSECFEFRERGWHSSADGINNGLHELLALGPVFLPVGRDHALVDAPRGLHLNMSISGKQVFQSCLLFLRQ